MISGWDRLFYVQDNSPAPRRHVFNHTSAAPLFRSFRAFTFNHWHDRISTSRDRRYFAQTCNSATPLTFVITDYQFEDIGVFFFFVHYGCLLYLSLPFLHWFSSVMRVGKTVLVFILWILWQRRSEVLTDKKIKTKGTEGIYLQVHKREFLILRHNPFIFFHSPILFLLQAIWCSVRHTANGQSQPSPANTHARCNKYVDCRNLLQSALAPVWTSTLLSVRLI